MFHPHQRSLSVSRRSNNGVFYSTETDIYRYCAIVDPQTKKKYDCVLSTQDCIRRLRFERAWSNHANRKAGKVTRIRVGFIYPTFTDSPHYSWFFGSPWRYHSSDYQKLLRGIVNPFHHQFHIIPLIRQALEAIESYINVQFDLDAVQPDPNKKNSTTNMEHKIVRIGFTNTMFDGSGGVAYLFRDYSMKQSDYGGDIWIDYKTKSDEALILYLIHELCHVLGLDHPHLYEKEDSKKNIRETWGDTTFYTCMSYVGPVLASLGLHDIMALGRIWGVRQSPPGQRHYLVDGDLYTPKLMCRDIKNAWKTANKRVIADTNIFALDCSRTKHKNLLIDGNHGVRDLDAHEPKVHLFNNSSPKILVGGSGNTKNKIFGNDSDNIIITLGSNDIISGGKGNDLILIFKNHGNVVIHEYKGFNKIILPDYSLDKFIFCRENYSDHLVIVNTINKKTIKIINFFSLLGNCSVYSADKVNVLYYGDTATTIDRLYELTKDSQWQHKIFNHVQPVMGYSPTLKTIVLRGYWGELKLPNTIEHICLSDLSSHSDVIKENKLKFSRTKNNLSVQYDFKEPYDTKTKENRLILSDFLSSSSRPPRISCQDGKQLNTQGWKDYILKKIGPSPREKRL